MRCPKCGHEIAEEKSVSGMYPRCPKCETGQLVPFFSEGGSNFYACTNCEYMFGRVFDNRKEELSEDRATIDYPAWHRLVRTDDDLSLLPGKLVHETEIRCRVIKERKNV